MPYLGHLSMAGVDSGVTAIGEPRFVSRIEAAGAKPGDVVMPADIVKLLRRAALTPPPAGQQLTAAEVDRKLSNLAVADRFAVKQALAGAKLVSLGRPA